MAKKKATDMAEAGVEKTAAADAQAGTPAKVEDENEPSAEIAALVAKFAAGAQAAAAAAQAPVPLEETQSSAAAADPPLEDGYQAGATTAALLLGPADLSMDGDALRYVEGALRAIFAIAREMKAGGPAEQDAAVARYAEALGLPVDAMPEMFAAVKKAVAVIAAEESAAADAQAGTPAPLEIVHVVPKFVLRADEDRDFKRLIALSHHDHSLRAKVREFELWREENGL